MAWGGLWQERLQMLSQAESSGRVIGKLLPSSSADAPLELTAQLARLRSALPRVVRRGASWKRTPPMVPLSQSRARCLAPAGCML